MTRDTPATPDISEQHRELSTAGFATGRPHSVYLLAVVAFELALWSFAWPTSEFKNLAILACGPQTGLERVSKLAGIGFTAGTISAILSRT